MYIYIYLKIVEFLVNSHYFFELELFIVNQNSSIFGCLCRDNNVNKK